MNSMAKANSHFTPPFDPFQPARPAAERPTVDPTFAALARVHEAERATLAAGAALIAVDHRGFSTAYDRTEQIFSDACSAQWAAYVDAADVLPTSRAGVVAKAQILKSFVRHLNADQNNEIDVANFDGRDRLAWSLIEDIERLMGGEA
jgi:hypothetical protein